MFLKNRVYFPPVLCMLVVSYTWKILRIDRHVAAAWPKDHNFNFYALKIQDIYLIDWYGGANTIPVNEYLTTNLNSM